MILDNGFKPNIKVANKMNIQFKKRRILFYCMQGLISGGSDTCLYYLLTQLDQSKNEPYLLYENESILVKKLRKIGVKTIPLKKKKTSLQPPPKTTAVVIKLKNNNPNELRLFASSLKSLIKKIPFTIELMRIILKNRIDIVHTNHFLTADRPMLLASILTRKRIVSHNRGLYSPDIIDVYISKYIDQIISMSDFSTSVYVKGGVLEAKCKTIYDGINPEEFKSSVTASTSVTVGCFGRLETWKGQQVLIEAAETIIKSVPDVKFLIVGDGSNELELKIQVNAKGLQNYFEFTGGVTNVKDYMDKCTLIVHTSIEPEPFGMVIIEAMALEKPVIATNFGGPLEIIENEIDGILIPPQNPSILAENIIKLIKNPSLRRQIGKEARRKVITKFDVKTYTRQIERVYEDISS
jgi:glycosyltransferase involved in cell wall biosynthesis